MDTIEVTIKPEHFRNAPNGYSNPGCVLWQALQQYSIDMLMVGPNFVTIGDDRYLIPDKEWGIQYGDYGPFLLPSEHPRSTDSINKLSAQAKLSLEGIPTIKLVLTKKV